MPGAATRAANHNALTFRTVPGGQRRRIKLIQREMGSFAEWLRSHHPKRKDEWVKLFKKTFVFTGGEIVGEFLMSTGYLPGAHREDCPVFRRIAREKPPWRTARGFRYD